MRAGKAYISSLGTTGLLVASSLLLLSVVGALVAFDRWPSQAAAEPETMAIGEQRDADPARAGTRVDIAPQAVAAAVTGATAEPAVADAAPAAGAAARGVQIDTAIAQAPVPWLEMQPATGPGPAEQPSAPPTASDTAPVPPPAAPSTPSPGAGTIPPEVVVDIVPGDDGVTEITVPLADATGQISPTLGTTVGDTTFALEGAAGR